MTATQCLKSQAEVEKRIGKARDEYSKTRIGKPRGTSKRRWRRKRYLMKFVARMDEFIKGAMFDTVGWMSVNNVKFKGG